VAKPTPAAENFFGQSRPIAIAHRGGDAAGTKKENTVAAFKSAQKLGYQYVETDIILAASGELVAIHGSGNFLQASTKRDITRPTLQKMTLDQIRYILRPGGDLVPTLEEVICSVPEMKFIFDLKTVEAAEPLAKFVKDFKLAGRVCVTGFNYRYNQIFNEACKPLKVCLGLTVGRGLRFKNMNMFMLKAGALTDIEAIFIHHSLVSTPMINLIHRHGFKAVVWTANSSLSIKHALRSGVDGVISDRVGLLKEVIESKKDPSGS
jgi:glycerophosphoryl diester phosphodiesterase